MRVLTSYVFSALKYREVSDLDTSAVHFEDALQHGQSTGEASKNCDWRWR